MGQYLAEVMLFLTNSVSSLIEVSYSEVQPAVLKKQSRDFRHNFTYFQGALRREIGNLKRTKLRQHL